MANPLSSITLPYQLLLSFALGNAAGPAVRPFAQTLENDAWNTHRVAPPTIYTTAPMAARGKIPVSSVAQWAHFQGYSDDVLAKLMTGSLVGPDMADLFEMWRRGFIDQARFEAGLTTLGVQPAWFGDLEQLRRTHLSPDQAANARQQMFISAQGQRDIAALYGIDAADADIQFELAGLPPGVETALAMLRRSIIDQAEFGRIVAEGHTKTKYTAELLQLEHPVLNAAVYVRSFLKGHVTRQEMHTGGALTGYTPKDLDLWELSEGRPATVHEIHIGYARGASLPGAANENDAIRTAVAQSDIRPEYAGLLIAGKYSYPSAFVLRALAQAGDLGNTAAVEQILLEIGWKPDFAAKVAAAWVGGTTAADDPHVTKAQNQLWTAAHRSYVAAEITDPTATAAIEAAGVPAASARVVLTLWAHERALVRKQLSPAQIVKAWKNQVRNPATGAAWTQAQATTELEARGYDQADAMTLLEL